MYEILLEKTSFAHMVRKSTSTSAHSHRRIAKHIQYYVINCITSGYCGLFVTLNNGAGGEKIHESCKLPPTSPAKLSSPH